MRVVLIGDIGWRYLYHLGDEAMTEAAIDMLRARGISDITLVAGQPAVSEEFYGLPCVTRAGFWGKWSRERNDRHLAGVSDILASGELPDASIYTAIRDCDAVVIAGGGNMNSRDYHLLYERLAAKRIAAHFAKPLYVTSQTVGPMLTDEDRARVVEIADYALAFGCREATTTALMRDHVAAPERVFHTLDDAVMLEADEDARAAARDIAGDGPYVVASFTDHLGTLWQTYDQYYADLANICKTVATENDVTVLLVPHAGSLDATEHVRDQRSNAQIARLANSPQVKATRMVTAREDIALIEGSLLSLSTRYHPIVFSTGLGKPMLAISPSYYSSVRMRGALETVGLACMVVNQRTIDQVPAAASESMAGHADMALHLADAASRARASQRAWWDVLVGGILHGTAIDHPEPSRTVPFAPRGEWSVINEATTPIFNDFAKEVDRSRELVSLLTANTATLATTEQSLANARATVQRFKNRKIVRAVDGTRRLLHRWSN